MDELELFYADKTTSFTGGLLNITIGNNGWNKQTSTGEGRFAGRLYRGSNPAADLTGVLEGFYIPANGAPRMKVTDEYLYAGWFDVMMLNEIPITYAFKPTGENIITNKDFDNLIALKSADASSKAIHLNVPAHKSYYSSTELLSGGLLSFTEFNADFAYWAVDGTSLPAGVTSGTLLDNMSISDSQYRSILFSPDGYGSFIKSTGGGALIFTIDFGSVLEFNLDKVIIQAKNTSGGLAAIELKNDMNTSLGILDIADGVSSFQEEWVSLGGYYDSTTNLRFLLPDAADGDIAITDIKIYRTVFEIEEKLATQHIYAMYDISTQAFRPSNSGDNGVGWTGTAATIGTAIKDSFALDYDTSTRTIRNYSLLDFNGAYSGNFVQWNPATCVSPSFELCFPTASSFPTNADCTTGDITSACFNILEKRLTYESLMPIDGPFTLVGTSDGYAPVKVFNCGATICDIEAFIVPGMIAADHGYTLLRMPANFQYDNDNIRCEDWVSQSVQRLEVEIGAIGGSIPKSMTTSGQLFACPYKKGSPKKYFPHVSRVHID
jgi:hypothetical protein